MSACVLLTGRDLLTLFGKLSLTSGFCLLPCRGVTCGRLLSFVMVSSVSLSSVARSLSSPELITLLVLVAVAAAAVVVVAVVVVLG